MKHKKKVIGWLLILLLSLSACTDHLSQTASSLEKDVQNGNVPLPNEEEGPNFQYENIPPYEGKESVTVNGGIPFFTSDELTKKAFEEYSDLDELGRCQTAFANVCRETMPTQERESIGNVKPTGWHTVKYDVIADRYLYNRCHLIGYQLTGENDNEKNLITGTRYLNVEGMLPWENLVADYVEETGNHVLYRVTPYFIGDNLLASGVLLEAYSVEDDGAGVCFCIYGYNVQPGVLIDYATGESRLDESWPATESPGMDEYDYVLNINTKKFHFPSCTSVRDMKDENKEYFSGDRKNLIQDGYSPCSRCKP